MSKNLKDHDPKKRIEELEKKKILYEKIDNELIQGVNLYRFIVENSHIGIFVIDDNFEVVYANNEMVNIVGYPLDEIVGSDFRDYLAQESREAVADRYLRRQGGEILPQRYEVDFFRKNGERRTVEISVAVSKTLADVVLTVVQVFDITDRKRVEAKLMKSEKKYRDLFENVFDIIYIHDLNGVFLETNAHYLSELGGSREVLINRTIKDFMPERFRSGFDDYLKRILKNGKDEGLLTIQVPGGHERTLEYRNSLIYDDAGNPVGVWGSARDITQLLNDKEALKVSEEKYRTIIQNIEDLYFEADLAGNLTFFNDAFIKNLGYSKEEYMGMNYREYVVAEDTDMVYSLFNEIFRTGKIGKGLNYRIKRKNGSIIHIETTCTLMKDNEGKSIGFRGISRDITERKEAESILRESEQRLREIIEGIPIPTFVINDKHHVTHWNEACDKLAGLKAGEIIGTDQHWKVFYAEPRPLLADLVLDGASKKTVAKYYGKKCRISKIVTGAYEGELFFPHLGKKGKWLFLTATPLKDSEGKTTGAIETMLDISEKKQAERNLLKIHNALEDKVKERTRNLEESNVALEVLLKKREGDRRDVEEQIILNIREVISPYIERLKSSSLKERQKVLLEIIERNLREITAPFMRGLSDTFHKLTPSEIQVINLIKQDKTTKEMANFLGISPRTVEYHRDNIRKKLDIQNKKINLRSYLLSIR